VVWASSFYAAAPAPSKGRLTAALCLDEGAGLVTCDAKAILVEAKVNARWSLDFVHDQFAQAGASASSTLSMM
jgi:hypothetical protein